MAQDYGGRPIRKTDDLSGAHLLGADLRNANLQGVIC
ncbi:pentapeptide repeat-containing protein [Moorena sp. SIO3I8]